MSQVVLTDNRGQFYGQFHEKEPALWKAKLNLSFWKFWIARFVYMKSNRWRFPRKQILLFHCKSNKITHLGTEALDESLRHYHLGYLSSHPLYLREVRSLVNSECPYTFLCLYLGYCFNFCVPRDDDSSYDFIGDHWTRTNKNEIANVTFEMFIANKFLDLLIYLSEI